MKFEVGDIVKRTKVNPSGIRTSGLLVISDIVKDDIYMNIIKDLETVQYTNFFGVKDSIKLVKKNGWPIMKLIGPLCTK